MNRIGFSKTNLNSLIVPLLKELSGKVDRLLETVYAMDNRMTIIENNAKERRRNKPSSATSEELHTFQNQSTVLLSNINKKLKKQCKDLEFLSKKAMLGEEDITDFTISTIEEMDEQIRLIACDPIHKKKLVNISASLSNFLDY